MKYASKLQRPSQQQTSSYSFQSSTVTYGGLNGAYYTSSTTRKTGGDGVRNVVICLLEMDTYSI